MTPDISYHAWYRFITRWPGAHLPACPMAELRRLMAIAQPEDIGYGNPLRIMSNGYQPATYLAAEGWRFVLTEDGTRLITVERRILKAKTRRKPKRKR